MKCPGCGHENSEGARFCNACGARLEIVCPACGHTNAPGSRFCSGCGKPLAVAAGPAPSPKFASPEGYTPTHLAEKILTSRSALEGERKQVTVLFADIKASMELIADRDPEDARRLLDPVLERMMEAVHRYEGIVNQVRGDGIMAIFGAPLAHEDHAVRACYAALAMQASIRHLREEILRSYGVATQVRVGLNSGEVLVRAIGADLLMDYTAVGQTTHLAARMEQLAAPGSIWLTPDTLRLAEGFVQVRPLGPVPVKGLAEPVEVFELTGAMPTRTRLQAAAARGLTRFVGRQTELEGLRQALERAATGHGQLVALVGEPGVGKSRLFWEFTHSHRTHGWLVLESGSVSYGKATAYLPVIDLLKSYFQIEDRDDGRKIREKLTGKLLTLERALEPTLPAFLTLLGVPVEDPQWEALDSLQRRQRTLDAVKRLLLRESQVQPLILVLEDLHWIDSETQAVLDSIVESLSTTRILLLVNYRPEYQHGWGTKTSYVQLRVDSLPPESAEELLRALLGDDPDLQPLKQLLIKGTEGNPFFLEESVRTLVETQTLVGERGAYRLTKPLTSIQVPATVQAVLAARIDRLPAEEKRLLQTAAVIGKDVLFSLLQATAERPEEELRTALAHLRDAEFLYEASLFPDLGYSFKHALTHEVAYGSIVLDRRRALHARIVEAIEALYADRLDDQIERLAHHAFRGEVWEKALDYCRRAGTRSAARSAHREAVGHFEQALVAVQQLPDLQTSREQNVDLRFYLRNSLLPLNDFGRMFGHLREAEALAATLGDQRRLGWASAYLTAYFCNLGDEIRATESGQRARAIATTLGDLSLQIMARFFLGLSYVYACKYDQAVDCLRPNVDELVGNLVHERFGEPGLPAIFSCSYLLRALAERGEFAEGVTRGEAALLIATQADLPFTLASALEGHGFLQVRRGDLQRAIPLLEQGLALCQQWQFNLLAPTISAYLGYAYTLSGRVGDALPLLTQAASIQAGLQVSLRVAWLGEAYLRAHRFKEAIDTAEQALALSLSRGEPGDRAWVLRLLAEINVHDDSPDLTQADRFYRQALELAAELGMRPLQAHCHLGLGSLYRRTGHPDQARAELSTAIDLYRAMGMTYWLPQAEADLAEVSA